MAILSIGEPSPEKTPFASRRTDILATFLLFYQQVNTPRSSERSLPRRIKSRISKMHF